MVLKPHSLITASLAIMLQRHTVNLVIISYNILHHTKICHYMILHCWQSACFIIHAASHDTNMLHLRNRRWGGYVYVLQMFFFVFFSRFFPSTTKYQTRIFMKRLPHDTGNNGVWNVVPPPGESHAADRQMANVDDLRNLRYDSGAITRGRHARRLRYTFISGRMDLI